MKNLYLTLLVVIACVFGLQAQSGIGAGAVYLDGDIGINARYNISLHQVLDIVPNVSYVFETPQIQNESASRIIVDMDIHLNKWFSDNLALYGLLGLGWGRLAESLQGISSAESNIGVNAGGGLKFNVSSGLNIFLEGKYGVEITDNIQWTAGVIIPFGGKEVVQQVKEDEMKKM